MRTIYLRQVRTVCIFSYVIGAMLMLGAYLLKSPVFAFVTFVLCVIGAALVGGLHGTTSAEIDCRERDGEL